MSEILEKYLVISLGLLINLMIFPIFFSFDSSFLEIGHNNLREEIIYDDVTKIKDSLDKIQNSSQIFEFEDNVQLNFHKYGIIEGIYEREDLKITFFFFSENFTIFQKFTFRVLESTNITGLNNSITNFSAGIKNSTSYINFH